jgi:hypothetical protein
VTPKLPATTAKELGRVAERLGFVFRRRHGRCAELDSLCGGLCYAGGNSANPIPERTTGGID